LPVARFYVKAAWNSRQCLPLQRGAKFRRTVELYVADEAYEPRLVNA